MAVVKVFRPTVATDEYGNKIAGAYSQQFELDALVAYGNGDESHAVGRSESTDTATIYFRATNRLTIEPNDRIQLSTGFYQVIADDSYWEDEYGGVGTTVRVSKTEPLW